VGSTTAGTATGSSTFTAVVSSVANAAGAGGSGGSGVTGGAGAAQSASATDGHQFASATAAAGGGVSKWSPNGNVSTQMTRDIRIPIAGFKWCFRDKQSADSSGHDKIPFRIYNKFYIFKILYYKGLPVC